MNQEEFLMSLAVAEIDLTLYLTTESPEDRRRMRLIFYVAGILTGAFIMGTCWMVTALG